MTSALAVSMKSLESKIETEMVACPKCGQTVARRNIERHLARAHSAEKERQSAAGDNLKIVNQARRVYLGTVVKCASCKHGIKLSEIKSHYATAHKSPAPLEMLALVGLSEPQNMFKSDREREAYWRAKSGFDGGSSDDVFDRGRVVSGGAYGLGKNRKH